MGSLWWFDEFFYGDQMWFYMYLSDSETPLSCQHQMWVQTETTMSGLGGSILWGYQWVLDSGYLQVKNHHVYDSEKYWEIIKWYQMYFHDWDGSCVPQGTGPFEWRTPIFLRYGIWSGNRTLHPCCSSSNITVAKQTSVNQHPSTLPPETFQAWHGQSVPVGQHTVIFNVRWIPGVMPISDSRNERKKDEKYPLVMSKNNCWKLPSYSWFTYLKWICDP